MTRQWKTVTEVTTIQSLYDFSLDKIEMGLVREKIIASNLGSEHLGDSYGLTSY